MARKPTRIWPRAVQTVGDMLEAGVVVRAYCDTCRSCFKVDLELLAKAHGRSFSLIGRRGACRLVGCQGTCAFQFGYPGGGPMQPLF